MLSWLFPAMCPCDPAAKAWVEQRLGWLAEQFPASAFTGRPVVLPTAEFFPAPYDGSNKAVRILFDQVCEYMDVDSYSVSLEFVAQAGKLNFVNGAGQSLPDAAGTYQSHRHFGDGMFVSGTPGIEPEQTARSLIRLDKADIDDPMALVGTIAHELAHVRLLGEGRVSSRVFDNELLTDLTVVHLGLGIFLANTPRTWDSQYTRWPNSDLRKPEYMTPPMFGWALAHLAWFRGEARPTWARHLRLGARANFRQGLRYLQQTGASSYAPQR
jgi:hypothetical protein